MHICKIRDETTDGEKSSSVSGGGGTNGGLVNLQNGNVERRDANPPNLVFTLSYDDLIYI